MLKYIYIGTIVLVGFGLVALPKVFNCTAGVIHIPTEQVEMYSPIVVLELFTSQGCSSCPAADVLLEKVKKEFAEEVFALSYHVDYWNYIGWNDPFSNPKATEKQSNYNRKFRNNGNYTPQLVVNGKEHFVGSDASKLRDKIHRYKTLKVANKVALYDVRRKGRNVSFRYALQGEWHGKLLRVVLVLDERTTAVKQGENRNRVIKNSNIVVAENLVTLTNPEGLSQLELPDGLPANDQINLIVLVENQIDDITGAAKEVVRG